MTSGFTSMANIKVSKKLSQLFIVDSMTVKLFWSCYLDLPLLLNFNHLNLQLYFGPGQKPFKIFNGNFR